MSGHPLERFIVGRHSQWTGFGFGCICVWMLLGETKQIHPIQTVANIIIMSSTTPNGSDCQTERGVLELAKRWMTCSLLPSLALLLSYSNEGGCGCVPLVTTDKLGGEPGTGEGEPRASSLWLE